MFSAALGPTHDLLWWTSRVFLGQRLPCCMRWTSAGPHLPLCCYRRAQSGMLMGHARGEGQRRLMTTGWAWHGGAGTMRLQLNSSRCALLCAEAARECTAAKDPGAAASAAPPAASCKGSFEGSVSSGSRSSTTLPALEHDAVTCPGTIVLLM